jgi:hypothetical protein
MATSLPKPPAKKKPKKVKQSYAKARVGIIARSIKKYGKKPSEANVRATYNRHAYLEAPPTRPLTATVKKDARSMLPKQVPGGSEPTAGPRDTRYVPKPGLPPGFEGGISKPPVGATRPGKGFVPKKAPSQTGGPHLTPPPTGPRPGKSGGHSPLPKPAPRPGKTPNPVAMARANANASFKRGNLPPAPPKRAKKAPGKMGKF